MPNKKPKSLSIVVPVYNEESTINTILNRVIKANTLGLQKEIIVVNDGSTDSTRQVLKKINHNNLRVFNFKDNRGKGAALRRGFSKSTGDIILVQDADLEYYPKEYPILLKPFLNGKASVVYGSRELSGKNKHSYAFFHLGGKIVTRFTNLLYGSNLTDEPTGYKAFRREVLLDLPLKCKRFEFCPEVTSHILKRGIEIVEVPISYSPRKKEEGKKINAKDGAEAMWTLLRVKFTA